MSRALSLGAFVLATLVIGIMPAAASPIVYNQPTVTPTPSVRASHDQGPPFGSTEFQTFDSFSLSDTALIDGVSWQGSYFNTFVANGAFQPPANASQFTVQFYADAAGAPGVLLANYVFAPSAANETFNRQEAFVLNPALGLAIYDYEVDLPSGFQALAGTTYWLSVYAFQPPSSPTEAQWGWNGGTGGNGMSFQTTGGIPAPGIVGVDRAFTLEGTVVPEPSTIFLVGLGAVGLARRLKNRSRAV